MRPIPSGRAAVYSTFGDPDDEAFEAKNIVRVALPFQMRYRGDDSDPWSAVTTCRVHRLVASDLVAALSEVWQHARVQVKEDVGYDKTSDEYDALTHDWLGDRRLDVFSGSYVKRAQRGSATKASMHAFGAAIDVCDGDFPQGSDRRLPDWYVAAFAARGWFYGGDFSTTKDPMHFQMAKGY